MEIFITGASKGIGLFLFQELKREGFNVFGTYYNSIPNDTEGFTRVNIQDTDEVNRWVNSHLQDNDNAVLLNCAGGNYNKVAHKSNVKDWSNLIDINLTGVFRAIQAILPHMRKTGFGRIINFGSVVAQKGVPGTSAYAASKAALWGLAKTISVENASKGITINTINLGYFDIGMISEVPEEYKQKIIEETPKNRLGDKREILQTVKYLINTEYITGTSVDLNGGYY